ncbi:hypothetical protein [Streptomyces scabiei]|uniref:hypothetical protein n=1 Tax=Streptomyces scabiei TaxID=1930 RepID=UPI001B337A38|nr:MULTISPECIES: hypothetical protein [Streptomyces]MBP5888822.1 hypothetical protein [Streptomyces sp. LBUM 1481]MBP5918836.1 hypothetical protein [Streptomyces sp. LBUM 1483]MDX2685107.1 hypothetical protein [Streptomyces scabiei]MDX2753370.1 hypothetical protein [Streptomyces scabiei]MDX2807551.1 hypothetical protein [Streptomyces scabiei]
MNIYVVEYTTPKTPPLRERKVQADDFAVKDDFVEFTATDGKKVFSVRADAVVTIAKEPPSS